MKYGMHAIESTKFDRLHNCENVKYVIFHSDLINAVYHLKKRVNQMGLRVYALIIFFMLLKCMNSNMLTLYILYNFLYRMVLVQIQ